VVSEVFINRTDAGVRLAEKLKEYKDREGVLVLALPRGGVAVGFELARRLNAGLDVLIVRKIGVPSQPELAAGAISETGTVYLNRDVISAVGDLNAYLEKEIARQREEISRRIVLYRGGAPIRELASKTIILVDDGVATGATMKAAIETMKKERIAKLVAAVPVAPPRTAEELRHMADEFVCIETPEYFMAVGSHYMDFAQVTDEEVVKLLRRSEIFGEKAA
jgi:putative phosphoribosyl transferase